MTAPAPPIVTGLDALFERLDATSSGRRRLVGVVGPPGSGKSYLCEHVRHRIGGDRVAVVPMDGFHLDNDVLADLGLAAVKGRADTFDAAGFVALLRRLRDETGTVVYAPRFDRSIETAVAGALAVGPSIDLVIVEGNYLLLDDGPWADVATVLDDVWYLDVPTTVRRERLLARHRQGHGDQAEDWIARVDEPNAAVVESTRGRASVVVRL